MKSFLQFIFRKCRALAKSRNSHHHPPNYLPLLVVGQKRTFQKYIVDWQNIRIRVVRKIPIVTEIIIVLLKISCHVKATELLILPGAFFCLSIIIKKYNERN